MLFGFKSERKGEPDSVFGLLPMTNSPARWILHLDMDAFYVSVERLLDPSLEGRAVLVGGDPGGRGVVASASYEARRKGVHSAMPMGRARMLCPEAVIIRGTHERYAEYSGRVHEILRRFSPLVEMASQDEAYVDLSGTERLWGAPWTAAERMRQTILEETRLPSSMGLAANKLLAKVASTLAKPRGFLRVFPGGEAALLAPLPIEALPGIGPKTAEKLHSFGIERLGDLVELGAETLEQLFGATGRELYERARGCNDSAVEPEREAKSIGREHTFPEDVDDPVRLISMLSELTEHVASALRADTLQARTITLKFRYADFQTHTASRTLLSPTDDEKILLETARDLLRRHWTRRVRLRLVGVSVSNLQRAAWQLDLFDEATTRRRIQLHGAVDALRRRHGFEVIHRARSLESEGKPMRKPSQKPEKKSGGR